MRIETLSTGDVLERSKKTYFKSSNIKLQSASFLPIALDIAEKDVFAHEADSSYRITFQLYEVDGLALKRVISNAYGTPGFSDLFTGMLSHLNGGLKLLSGSLFHEALGGAADDKSVLERVLLKAGASLEFKGSVLIVRAAAASPQNGADASAAEIKQEYLLYDKLKSEANWNFDIRPASDRDLAYGEKAVDGWLSGGSYQAYQQALAPIFDQKSQPLCIPKQICTKSYIRLKLMVKKLDTQADAQSFRLD